MTKENMNYLKRLLLELKFLKFFLNMVKWLSLGPSLFLEQFLEQSEGLVILNVLNVCVCSCVYLCSICVLLFLYLYELD